METQWTKRRFQAHFEEYKISKEIHAHQLYYIPSIRLVNLRQCEHICKWSRNRPYNKERVEKLCNYQNSQTHVNGIIHLAYLADEDLVCYGP
jgi:hypothetical protein